MHVDGKETKRRALNRSVDESGKIIIKAFDEVIAVLDSSDL
jgi:hypothetical protein